MIKQYHLKGKHCSGRAVRVRALDDVQTADNLTAAARQAGTEAIYAEVKKAEWRIGITQFVIEVSEPCEDPSTAKFRKVNVRDFEEGLSTFFTAKDVVILEAIYREFHELNSDELEAIVGKGLEVSGD